MKKQIDIFAFHKLLHSDSEDDEFLTALQRLTQQHDAERLGDIRAYEPFRYTWRWGR